jgi:hypothetical protein
MHANGSSKASPVVVLRELAWARAMLYRQGECELEEAIEIVADYAVRLGVMPEIAEQIIADAFEAKP